MKARATCDRAISVGIVANDETARDSLAVKIAGMRGFRVVGLFAASQGALRAILSQPPEILLIDLHLPDIPKIDWAHTLEAPNLPTKLMFVADCPPTDLIKWATQFGGASFLVKPFSTDELAAALTAASEGGIYLSASVRQGFLRRTANEDGPSESAPLPRLNSRERAALDLCAQGLGYKQVAEKLGVRYRRLDKILARVRAKLGVHSLTAAFWKVLAGERAGENSPGGVFAPFPPPANAPITPRMNPEKHAVSKPGRGAKGHGGTKSRSSNLKTDAQSHRSNWRRGES